MSRRTHPMAFAWGLAVLVLLLAPVAHADPLSGPGNRQDAPGQRLWAGDPVEMQHHRHYRRHHHYRPRHHHDRLRHHYPRPRTYYYYQPAPLFWGGGHHFGGHHRGGHHWGGHHGRHH